MTRTLVALSMEFRLEKIRGDKQTRLASRVRVMSMHAPGANFRSMAFDQSGVNGVGNRELGEILRHVFLHLIDLEAFCGAVQIVRGLL